MSKKMYDRLFYENEPKPNHARFERYRPFMADIEGLVWPFL